MLGVLRVHLLSIEQKKLRTVKNRRDSWEGLKCENATLRHIVAAGRLRNLSLETAAADYQHEMEAECTQQLMNENAISTGDGGYV